MDKLDDNTVATEQKDQKFEESLEHLEDILSIMESGELSLEDAIEKFREGSKLYKLCQKKLESAEGEIKILMENLNGEIEEEDFDSGD